MLCDSIYITSKNRQNYFMVLKVKIMVVFEEKKGGGAFGRGGVKNLWGAAYVLFVTWMMKPVITPKAVHL